MAVPSNIVELKRPLDETPYEVSCEYFRANRATIMNAVRTGRVVIVKYPDGQLVFAQPVVSPEEQAAAEIAQLADEKAAKEAGPLTDERRKTIDPLFL